MQVDVGYKTKSTYIASLHIIVPSFVVLRLTRNFGNDVLNNDYYLA